MRKCRRRSHAHLLLLNASLAFAAFACAAPMAQGGAPAPELLTLDSALALAFAANPKLDNASLEVQKATAGVAAAKTQLLPSLSLDASESHNFTAQNFTYDAGAFGVYPIIGPIPATTTQIGSQSGATTIVTASVAQPLSQLYRLGLAVDQHKVMQSLAEQDLRAKRLDLIKDVKQQYYEILKTQSSQAATEESIAFYRELVELTARYVQEKVAFEYQSLDARSRLARVEHKARVENNTLLTQMARLNALLGRDIKTTFRVTAAAAKGDLPPASEDAEAAALAKRPELQAAKLKLEHAGYGYDIKKSEYMPDVSLVMRYSRLYNVQFIPSQVWTVGLELKWDIYDWGRKSDQLGQKTADILQARNDIREAESQILIDVDTNLRKVDEAREYVKVAQMAQAAAREKLRVTMDQYRQRAALLTNVLQAESDMADANEEYQKAVLSLFAAKAQLDKSMGEG